MNQTTPRTARAVRLLLLSCLLSQLLFPLAAGGSKDPGDDGPHTYTSYLVTRRSETVNETYLKQFFGLPALAAFGWTGFSVTGGTVSLEAGKNLSGVSMRLEEAVDTGAYSVRKILLTASVSPVGRTPGGERKTITVSFSLQDLLNADGAVLFQPHQYARMLAVRSGTLSAGSVLLKNLRQTAAGFSAEVEIAGRA